MIRKRRNPSGKSNENLKHLTFFLCSLVIRLDRKESVEWRESANCAKFAIASSAGRK